MKTALLILKKDITVELSGMRIIPVVLVMGLLILLVFSFSLGQSVPNSSVAAAILWVSFLFSGIVAIERCFDCESQNNVLSALRTGPGNVRWLFLGKVLWVLLLLYIIEIWIGLSFVVLFDFNLYGSFAALLLIVSLFNVGFAGLGVLFAAITCNCKGKSFLLVIVLLPLLTPIIAGSVSCAGAVMDAAALSGLCHWLKLLAGFDIISLALAQLLFGYAIEG